MDDQSPVPIPPRRRFRWLKRLCIVLTLLALALLVTEWVWERCTSTMHRVLRIPLKRGEYLMADIVEPVLFGVPGGLCLRREHPSADPNAPSTLTLIGWDGKPRWHVTTVVSNRVYDGRWMSIHFLIGNSARRNSALTISPDGRALAVAQKVGQVLQIKSWLDGRPLGEASIPLIAFLPSQAPMTITNSGRIWLSNYKATDYRAWAIDGKKVASGSYKVTPEFPNQLYLYQFFRLSPDGSALICTGSKSLDYATVQVQGTHIEIKRRYATNQVGYFYWIDNQWARGRKGLLAGPNGICKNPVPGTNSMSSLYHTQVLVPPPGHSWELPVNAPVISRGNGSAALVWSYPPLPHWLEGAAKWDCLKDRLMMSVRPRLNIYTAPGHKSAELAIPVIGSLSRLPHYFEPMPITLSQDGHRMALVVENHHQFEIWVYAW